MFAQTYNRGGLCPAPPQNASNSFLIEKQGDLNVVTTVGDGRHEPLILSDSELLVFLHKKRTHSTAGENPTSNDSSHRPRQSHSAGRTYTNSAEFKPPSDTETSSSSCDRLVATPPKAHDSSEGTRASELRHEVMESCNNDEMASPEIMAWIDKCEEVTVAATIQSTESRRAIEDLRRKCEELESKYSVTLKNRVIRENSANFIGDILNSTNLKRFSDTVIHRRSIVKPLVPKMALNESTVTTPSEFLSNTIQKDKDFESTAPTPTTDDDDVIPIHDIVTMAANKKSAQKMVHETSNGVVETVLNSAIARFTGTYKLSFAIPELSISEQTKPEMAPRFKELHKQYDDVLSGIQKEYEETQRVIHKLRRRQIKLERAAKEVRFADPVVVGVLIAPSDSQSDDFETGDNKVSDVNYNGKYAAMAVGDEVEEAEEQEDKMNCYRDSDRSIKTPDDCLNGKMPPAESKCHEDANTELNQQETDEIRTLDNAGTLQDEEIEEGSPVNDEDFLHDVMELLASETSAVLLLQDHVSGMPTPMSMNLQTQEEVEAESLAAIIADSDTMEPEEYLRVVESVREIRSFLFATSGPTENDPNRLDDCNSFDHSMMEHNGSFSSGICAVGGPLGGLNGGSILSVGVGTHEESVYLCGDDDGSMIDGFHDVSFYGPSGVDIGADGVRYDLDGTVHYVDMEMENKSMFEDYKDSLFESENEDDEMGSRGISIVNMKALEREMKVLAYTASVDTSSVSSSRRWQQGYNDS
jgi:hypothetical protein